MWRSTLITHTFNDAQTIFNSQFPILRIWSDWRESDRTLGSWRDYQTASQISLLRQVSRAQIWVIYHPCLSTPSARFTKKRHPNDSRCSTCTGRGRWRSWSSGQEAREGCRTGTPLGTYKGQLGTCMIRTLDQARQDFVRFMLQILMNLWFQTISKQQI